VPAAARLIPLDRLWPAALVALCALVGLLAGVEPKFAIVAAIGLAFALLLFTNFAAGLAFFAFFSFLELLHLGSIVSVGKLGGGMVVLAWVATIATRDKEEEFVEAYPVISLVIGLFLAWVALGVTWAESPSEVVGALTRYVPNALMILVVFTAVRNKRQALMIVAGIVLGAVAASAYGLLNQPPAAARLEGSALDPNELGSVLVAGVALSGAFAANMKGRPELRLAAIGVAGLCVIGIFLTVSRGGLLALTASLLTAIVFAGRWRPLALAATAVIAASSFYYFAVIAPPEATERLQLTTDGETALLEGRTTIWEVAERAAKANPVTGVGAGNFQISARHYLLQPGALGRTDLIIATPKVVHNTYLGIAAELGLVGLGLFVVIVLFSVSSAIRAARHFTAIGDRGGEALARGLTVGLVGILVADFFISQEYNKELWLLLGLGPALLAIARSERARRTAAADAERSAAHGRQVPDWISAG
jgi:putative inorganic carbon (HCO3(-)) transporter